jgi:hypothetical protein
MALGWAAMTAKAMICDASASHVRKCKAALPVENEFIFTVDFSRFLAPERKFPGRIRALHGERRP